MSTWAYTTNSRSLSGPTPNFGASAWAAAHTDGYVLETIKDHSGRRHRRPMLASPPLELRPFSLDPAVVRSVPDHHCVATGIALWGNVDGTRRGKP